MADPTIKAAPILVIADSGASVTLLARLLEVSGFTNVVSSDDPARAVALCAEGEPELVLIDVAVPDPAGTELLGALSPWITGAPPLPVVLVADGAGAEIRRRALGMGASDVLDKPYDPGELVLRVEHLLGVRAGARDVHERADSLAEQLSLQATQLERSLEELEHERHEVLRRLAMAAEFRDDGSREHTERVGRTAALLAKTLGLGDDEAAVIRSAAPLHDVGKLGISDSILLNPGRLTEGEFELMKSHAAIGAAILGGGRSRLLQVSEEIAIAHHERWDGGGYPAGLTGQAIPLTGRIVALADTFDVITHERPYKQAASVPDAVAEILGLSGEQFDPRVVEAFSELDHQALLDTVAIG